MDLRQARVDQVRRAINIVDEEIYQREKRYYADDTSIRQMNFVLATLNNFMDMLQDEKPKDKWPNPIDGQKPLIEIW